MLRTESALPKGVRDILPLTTARRNDIINKIMSVFEKYGYLEVTTPLLEYLDEITEVAGRDLKKNVVRLTDRATGRALCIRPDFTPQVARIVSIHYKDKKMPLRFAYRGSVVRLASDSQGGQQEIYQTGIELFGDPTPEGDAEIISVAIEALNAAGLKGFKIDIGQVEFVRSILHDARITSHKREEVLDAISKKDISALAEITDGLKPDIRKFFSAIPYLFGGEEVLKNAKELAGRSNAGKAVEDIAAVVKILKKRGYFDHLSIDMGEIRGFDYHTGIIIEAFAGGVGRAVCSGGRYDNLMEGFGFPCPATGFTIDLNNIMNAVESQK